LLTACSALLVVGCGGKSVPKLAHADAAPLIALAHRIAHEGNRGQARDIPRLQSRVIALINTGRVPADLQEPLSSAANGLVETSSPARNARDLEAWLKQYSD
jgi:hypothetical protein